MFGRSCYNRKGVLKLNREATFLLNGRFYGAIVIYALDLAKIDNFHVVSSVNVEKQFNNPLIKI